MKKIVDKTGAYSRDFKNLFLIGILFIFSILRIPSLVEPDWYGDEGIYQVIGMAIRQGKLLYGQIWDNKPPVLYLIFSIFNGDLFFARLLSLIAGIVALVLIFLLSKRLFGNKKSIYIATASFGILFGLPLLEGNIANAENFMLAPIILAALLLFKKEKSSKHYLLSGLILSLAFLTKIVAVFDFAAFLIFIFITRFYRNFNLKTAIKMVILSIKNRRLTVDFKDEIIFVLSFISPIIVAFAFFAVRGALTDFYKATFSQNVGYVGYGNYFLFPMGRLILKLVVLFAALLLAIKFRQRVGQAGFFILVWLMFSLFNCLFSERPYTHYVLVLLPSFSLFLGYIWENKKLFVLNLAILIFLFLVISKSFYMYTKISAYYVNYLSFLLGKKSVTSYQSFFDKNTPRDYLLAGFIKANTTSKDYIFLWSDSGQIYALSQKLPPGRYIVSYHITFYKNAIVETQNAIDKLQPKYIIATKDIKDIYYLLRNYDLKMSIKNAQIYERQL